MVLNSVRKCLLFFFNSKQFLMTFTVKFYSFKILILCTLYYKGEIKKQSVAKLYTHTHQIITLPYDLQMHPKGHATLLGFGTIAIKFSVAHNYTLQVCLWYFLYFFLLFLINVFLCDSWQMSIGRGRIGFMPSTSQGDSSQRADIRMWCAV